MSERTLYVIANLSNTVPCAFGKPGWHYVIPAEDGGHTYGSIEDVVEAFTPLATEHGHDLETAGIFRLVRVPHEEIVGAIKQALVMEAFDTYLLWDNDFEEGDQSNFILTARSRFLQEDRLEEADLYEAPFTAFGLNAFDRLFTAEQRASFLAFLRELAEQVAHLEAQAA